MKYLCFILIGLILSFSSLVSQTANDGKPTEEDNLLLTAVSSFGAGNYVEALNTFKFIIETPEFGAPNRRVLFYSQALVGIGHICKTTYRTEESLGLDYKELLEYLNLKTRTKDDENVVINYRTIYAGTLANVDRCYEALSEFEDLLKMVTINDDNKRQILSWLWYIYNIRQWEPEKEAEILGKIKDLEKDINGVVSIDNPTDLPTDYSLSQNYPNPFNPTTIIQYSIPKDEFVKLTVYDITGKVVKELVSGHKAAGRYSVEFNASSYSSGIYYYKIEAGQYNSTQKMMLIK